MRKVFTILCLVCFALVISCQSEEETPSEFLALVPQKTAVIIKSNQFSDFTTDLSKEAFFSQNQDLPFIQSLTKAFEPLKSIKFSDNSLFLFSIIGREEIAMSVITNAKTKQLDTLSVQKKEEFTYNGETITSYQNGDKEVFSATPKGLFVWSESKLVIENIIRLSRDNLEPDEKLKKLYESTSNRKSSVLINLPEFQKLYRSALPLATSLNLSEMTDWAALDISFKKEGLGLNGVTLPERNKLLGLLKNTTPQKSEIASITPVNARGVYSFTYDDFDILKDNLSFYRKTDYPKIDTSIFSIFSIVNEIGQIFTTDGKPIVVLNTKSPQDADQTLSPKLEKLKTFREHEIYSFSDGDYFRLALHPLINTTPLNYYTKLGHFLLFAKDPAELEYIIASYQNDKILAKQSNFENTEKKLDEKSSILLIGINEKLSSYIAESVDKKEQKAYQNIKIAPYLYSGLQFITHDNFTYINGSLIQSEANENSSNGAQLKTIKVEENIISSPWFLENWQTHQQDIIVQGESNTLYSYNAKGSLNWKTKLDAPIVGEPEIIDIYHNKRLQIAFATRHTFYIIDRLGNIVKPFQKQFNDPITQPLAVFDYNKNGEFRFLITQDNEVTMLDKTLKKVSGFEFTKANSTILNPPKHYRLGNKDYLLIPEESGKLNILNPRGQTRIKTGADLKLSENAWYLYKDVFTSTTTDGQLLQIDTQGQINRKKLGLDAKHKMTATANTLVTLSENKLSINDKTIKLNFGLYTEPEIHYLNNKIYISLTDLQDHKVYVFDSQANPISGFPVYGNSKANIQNIDNQGGLELVVKGEEDSVLIYQLD